MFTVTDIVLPPGLSLKDWIKTNTSTKATEDVYILLKAKLAVLHKNDIAFKDLSDKNVYIVGTKRHVKDVLILDYIKSTTKTILFADMIRSNQLTFDEMMQTKSDPQQNLHEYVATRLLDNNDFIII